MKTHAGSWVALCLFAAGCGSPQSGENPNSLDPTGKIQQEMLDASQVSTANLPSSGVVRLTITPQGYPPITCSGTLLTNRWVLTANHCFCNGGITPAPGVMVSMYGYTANTANPTLGQLYSAPAVQIIGHPTEDVALVKLGQTLPLTAPPAIYTGTGADLPGTSTSVYGFGNYYTDQWGNITGAGEVLTTATERVDRNDSMTGVPIITCGGYTTLGLPATGPFAVGTNPDLKLHPRASEGDSGGPMFRGPSIAPTLVAVTHGSTTLYPPSFDTFEGIWRVRDWIKQSMFAVPTQSACDTPLPSSAGAGKGTIAEGPDGCWHVVAVQSDNTIGHWRICFGSVTKVGTVPGATTSDPVGLGLESVAASGKPLKMGLAYREKTTGLLKYARWSASTGWSTPVGVRSLSILGGPAMTKGGPVAFVYTNSRAYVTFYDPTTDTFSSLSRPPVDPTTVADPTKRLSVGFDPAFGGITFLGWRMANGNFVQSTGSLSCSTYFCASDPAYPNSWTSAMLAYGPGQRLSIATTHTVSGVNVFENRVISGGTNYGWGGNQRIDYGIQPGVAQIGDDIMVVDSNTSGLFVSRSDDCFANDF